MMIMLFWIATAILSVIALFFILPAIMNKKIKFSVIFIFVALVYFLYASWGSSADLQNYYSVNGNYDRIVQHKIRPLFSQLKMQQGRLRLRLGENPEDIIAKALLLELMGVEALYHEDHALALKFWEGSLNLLSKTQEADFIKKRILGLKQHVEQQGLNNQHTSKAMQKF